MLPNAFVIIWNGQPIGLDSDSGGYPYKTEYAGSVKYWATREDARKYLDVFASSPSYGFYAQAIIQEVQFRIVD